MDLTVDIEEYRLNVRTVGIIIHDNKVLMHKNPNDSYYALVGGRVKVGEDSSQTVKREIMEELGKEVDILEPFAHIENFFEAKSHKYHEIMTAYKVEFVNEEDKKIINTMNCIEPGKKLKYEWLDIQKLDEFDIRPKLIKKAFKESTKPVYIINREI